MNRGYLYHLQGESPTLYQILAIFDRNIHAEVDRKEHDIIGL